jgi:hypothetical protein
MPKFMIKASYTSEGMKGLQKDKASGREKAIANSGDDHVARNGNSVRCAATGHRNPARNPRPRSGTPSRTLHGRSATTSLWRWLAVLVPIRSMSLVPSRHDPWLVGWVSILVEGGHDTESRHHPPTIPLRLT